MPRPDRIQWTPDVATKHHIEVLNSAGVIPPDYQPAFNRTAEQFLNRAMPLFASADFQPIHGDCHRGNIIHRPGEGLFLVDFDDMAIGPVVQDLWMLLPGRPDDCDNEINWFLQGYNLFGDFPHSLFKLVPALRGMRLIHFASWCAVQSNEEHFKHHFPEWGKTRYWNELVKDLQEVIQDIVHRT
ncbi:MAG: phosphotransferase [Candidatus Margulisiibacteriota bacterium]